MPLEQGTIDKIARFCQVRNEHVLNVRDMPSTYQVPLLLKEQKLDELMTKSLQLDFLRISSSLQEKGSHIWDSWKSLALGLQHVYEEVNIVLVGKYLEQPDSYLSVIRYVSGRGFLLDMVTCGPVAAATLCLRRPCASEILADQSWCRSLEHASMRCRRKLVIKNVDAEALEPKMRTRDPAAYHKAWHDLCTSKGVLVPGGFGSRGTEGMVAAAKWAREEKKPYLGICLGMQTAVVEFARSVCNIPVPQATSFEVDGDDEDRVIISMPEHQTGKLGGTMRLGLRATHWQPDTEWSKLRALYGLHNSSINERHRHRYEVNPTYIEQLQSKGLTFIGKDDTGVRMEVIELKDHPWFVGVQFHPEYISRVLHPSKPYLGFVAASAGMLADVTHGEGVVGAAVNGIHKGLENLTNGHKADF